MRGIRGIVRLRPRHSVATTLCDDSILPGRSSALACFGLAQLAACVTAPVRQKTQGVLLQQTTAPDWDRHLVSNHELGPPFFHPPILVSAGSKWCVQDGQLEIYDRAFIIDGAKRLEAALHIGSPPTVPVTVVFGLTSDEELSLRQRILAFGTATVSIETRDRFETTTPRLTVGETWVDVQIQSDPFVVLTRRGYTPALLIRRRHATISEHLLIGAKSIADELEAIRNKRGTLRGCHVTIRKQTPDRTAPYELRLLQKEGK